MTISQEDAASLSALLDPFSLDRRMNVMDRLRERYKIETLWQLEQRHLEEVRNGLQSLDKEMQKP